MHWNDDDDDDVWLSLMLEHVPLFKHGLLEHGLESLWHAKPVLYILHWHIYLFNELRTHTPWLVQLVKHADKSATYVDKILFKSLPVLFRLNNIDGFIDAIDWVESISEVELDDEVDDENDDEVDADVWLVNVVVFVVVGHGMPSDLKSII